MLYLTWDSLQKSSSYSSDGHEHISSTERRHVKLSVVEFMLGYGRRDRCLPGSRELNLAGDKVILYTDGVTEARNAQ